MRSGRCPELQTKGTQMLQFTKTAAGTYQAEGADTIYVIQRRGEAGNATEWQLNTRDTQWVLPTLKAAKTQAEVAEVEYVTATAAAAWEAERVAAEEAKRVAAEIEADKTADQPEPKLDAAEKPLTRKECNTLLRTLGYTGPTSYLMPKLREIVEAEIAKADAR